eukprot:tig00021038_g17584.t1
MDHGYIDSDFEFDAPRYCELPEPPPDPNTYDPFFDVVHPLHENQHAQCSSPGKLPPPVPAAAVLSENRQAEAQGHASRLHGPAQRCEAKAKPAAAAATAAKGGRKSAFVYSSTEPENLAYRPTTGPAAKAKANILRRRKGESVGPEIDEEATMQWAEVLARQYADDVDEALAHSTGGHRTPGRPARPSAGAAATPAAFRARRSCLDIGGDGAASGRRPGRPSATPGGSRPGRLSEPFSPMSVADTPSPGAGGPRPLLGGGALRVPDFGPAASPSFSPKLAGALEKRRKLAHGASPPAAARFSALLGPTGAPRGPPPRRGRRRGASGRRAPGRCSRRGAPGAPQRRRPARPPEAPPPRPRPPPHRPAPPRPGPRPSAHPPRTPRRPPASVPVASSPPAARLPCTPLRARAGSVGRGPAPAAGPPSVPVDQVDPPLLSCGGPRVRRAAAAHDAPGGRGGPAALSGPAEEAAPAPAPAASASARQSVYGAAARASTAPGVDREVPYPPPLRPPAPPKAHLRPGSAAAGLRRGAESFCAAPARPAVRAPAPPLRLRPPPTRSRVHTQTGKRPAGASAAPKPRPPPPRPRPRPAGSRPTVDGPRGCAADAGGAGGSGSRGLARRRPRAGPRRQFHLGGPPAAPRRPPPAPLLPRARPSCCPARTRRRRPAPCRRLSHSPRPSDGRHRPRPAAGAAASAASVGARRPPAGPGGAGRASAAAVPAGGARSLVAGAAPGGALDDELAAMLCAHNAKFRAPAAYEPRPRSAKDVREWEAQTGRHWYELSAEQRAKANGEIAAIARSR